MAESDAPALLRDSELVDSGQDLAAEELQRAWRCRHQEEPVHPEYDRLSGDIEE